MSSDSLLLATTNKVAPACLGGISRTGKLAAAFAIHSILFALLIVPLVWKLDVDMT